MKKVRLFIFTIIVILLPGQSCVRVKGWLVDVFGSQYRAEKSPINLKPSFDEVDSKLKRIDVNLTAIATGFTGITEIAFLPTDDTQMIVLEKEGRIFRFNLKSGKRYEILRIPVLTNSEQGLLGIAFHPQFEKNGLFYLNYSARSGKKDISRVSEWLMTNKKTPVTGDISGERMVMEVEQPYPNHNAGRLDFGPDGMLYVGWGDGGWRGDPGENGQNPDSFLGAMLRIDVNTRGDGNTYGIPGDNPFLNKKGFRPEVWAYGFRNPWKYSFDQRGRLVVADVGQDRYEEIDIVVRGGNYGWDEREASHCYEPAVGCRTEGLIDPVYEYGRDSGHSITGGYSYTGKSIPELRGLYVFADFVHGRLRAIRLPESYDKKAKEVFAIGKWDMRISTFGRNSEGELFLGDFSRGSIYKLSPGMR